MSNYINYSNTWYLDTEGVISPKPVWIKKAVLVPNAADDKVTFTYWGPESPLTTVRSTMMQKSVAVTLTTTITSTGNFEATEALANDIIQITRTDETTVANVGFFQIGTRTDDNEVICDAGYKALTNDASGTYDWKVWKPSNAFILQVEDANKNYELDFGPTGHRFPNLAMNGLSASATIYLYIR